MCYQKGGVCATCLIFKGIIIAIGTVAKLYAVESERNKLFKDNFFKIQSPAPLKMNFKNKAIRALYIEHSNILNIHVQQTKQEFCMIKE